MSEIPELFRKTVPVTLEAGIALIIGFVVVASFTFGDIAIHDSYVLPAIETCFPENQEDFCKNIRNRLDLPADAQIEIGNAYWEELSRQAVFIGVILFSIRILFGVYLNITSIRSFRFTTLLIAIFWGLVGSGLFVFGFLDTFYYWFQFESPPATLDWLNGAGIFTETKSYTGDPNVVEIEDLYFTNILGIGVLGAFLFFTMYVFSKAGYKRGIP